MRKGLIVAIVIFIVFIPVYTQAGVFDNLNKINNPLSSFKNLKNDIKKNFLIIEKILIFVPTQAKKQAIRQINDVKISVNEKNRLADIFIAKLVDITIDNNKNIYQEARAGFLDNFSIIEEIVLPISEIKSRVRNIFTINNKQEKIQNEQKVQAKAEVDAIYNQWKTGKEVFNSKLAEVINKEIILPEKDLQRMENNEQRISFLIEQINDLKKEHSETLNSSSFPINESAIKKNEIDEKLIALKEELENQIKISSNRNINQVVQVLAPTGNNEGSYNLNIQNSLTNRGALTQEGAAIFNAQATFNNTVSIGALLSSNSITIAGIVEGNMTDNIINAFDIQQGANNYININTIDLLEEIQFGNTTINPDYAFLGSGALFINATLSSSIIPTTDSSIDLGSNAKQFNNIFVRNVNTSGISSSNQAVFTLNPLDATIANSSVLINTTTAGANEALLGIAIAGAEKFRVDTEGDIMFSGNLIVNTNKFYVDATAGKVGIGTTTPLSSLHISSTDGLIIPVGTTLQRLVSPSTGTIRYNSTTSQFEGYSASSWGSLGGLIDVDQDTYISAEDSAGADNDQLKFFTTALQRMIIDSNGNVGIGTTTPSAILHLKAGAATASTAPLKFSSGALNTTAEAGAVEFLTDAYYGTITTGAARKTFAFLESPVFTTSITGSYLTPSEILITDASKNLVSAAVATYPSLAELAYVKGVTSAIQTQMDLKAPLASPTFTGAVTIPTPFTLGATSVTSTGTQLNYLNAATGTTGTTNTNLVFSTSPVLTTPALGTPSALVLTNATGLPTASILAGTFGTGAYVMDTSLTSPILYGSSADNGDLTIHGTSSATKTTSYLILQPDGGNVGIGTTNPGNAMLAINKGDANYDLYSSGALDIIGSTGEHLGFGIDSDLGSLGGAWISAQQAGVGVLNLLLQPEGGNVGIGTTGPGGTLHVFKASAGTITANSIADELVVETNVQGGISILTPNSVAGVLAWGDPEDNLAALMQYRHDVTRLEISTHEANGSIQFATGAESVAMTINSGGNVGIGDASPDYKLELSVAAGSDLAFGISDGDVAHGFTDNFQADTFLHFGPISSEQGAGIITGLSDAVGRQGLVLRGLIGNTDPTDTVPAVEFRAGKLSAATLGDLGAAETAFQFNDSDANTSFLTILGNGNV